MIATTKKLIIKALRHYEKRIRPIRCYAWKPQHSNWSFTVNFGDDIFHQIARRLLKREIKMCNLDYPGRKLLIGGSTIGLASSEDLVWGAGLRDGILPGRIRNLEVMAVRGPMTARVLSSRGICVPEVYGDPAILLPQLCSDWEAPEKTINIGIVPHFSDLDYFKTLKLPPDSVIISPLQSAKETITAIRSCKQIVASSLHGIICAEVYGVPVVPFRTTSASPEPDFKYEDYYSATNREWMPSMDVYAALNKSPGSSPDYSHHCRRLMASFPFDAF